MIKNHFKIALRSLKKQPFFTFLNTFGLAIGMAGGLLISLYIYDELNYDNMFADADRIHRVNVDMKFGGEENLMAVVSAPMAATIKKDLPQVDMVTRFRSRGSALIKKSDTDLNTKEPFITYVDANFFEMFGIHLLAGDPKTALKETNTLVLTKSAAEKHFGLHYAVGQSVTLNNNTNFMVAGVIDDLPKNSFLRDYSVFMSMTGYEEALSNEWGDHNFATFIKLLPSAKIEDVQVSLQSMFRKYMIPWAQDYFPGITEEKFLASGNYLNYTTIPLTKIHLHSNKDVEMSPNGDIKNIYILSFIGLFLLILASVNFMNLSTAQSLKRAKEVGIRKTLGSSKIELIRQFLTESGLISFISLVLALIIATIAMPFFNDLSGKDISMPFLNPFFWLVLLLSVAILGIFSGMYPAFFMSRFSPIKVLKGSRKGSTNDINIRNSLVVFQFAISAFLIVSTLVVFQQLKFIQNKSLGYTKDHVLIIEDMHAAGDKAQIFKQEIQQLGQVESATLTGYLPTPSYRSDGSFFEEGTTNQEDAVQMQRWVVDYDYVNTLGLKIIAGRNFDKKYATDSLAMIVNETAVKIMGIQPEEAIGKRMKADFTNQDATFSTIIGVVKDFHFESLRNSIDGLSMSIGNPNGKLAVKINSGDLTNTVSHIESIWKKIVPGQPFNYSFMEESFNTTYQAERRLGSIFTVFTLLSILIACLGLFGLAAFNAEKRSKEIGIRKVLGASVSQITYKLSIDFLKLVGIAILISLPLAWYAMNKWLEDFEYRIEIGWGVFVLATVLAIAISILTVSYQGIKAAIANPIKSLRTE
jgi:putative ABC transport system permease protein